MHTRLSRRQLLGWMCTAPVAAAASSLSWARPGPTTAMALSPLLEDLVAANRVLAQQGVLDGYGHVSVRADSAPNRYLMSRSLAPALVATSDILEYDLDSNARNDGGRASFVERFIHGEIYKVRPDVRAIVHSHSPELIPFGVTTVALKPVYHMSWFVGAGVPVFEIRNFRGDDPKTPMLVHNPALGRALAQTLGQSAAALMRGHGAVIVAPSLPEVVARSVYLTINARLQAQALALGGPVNYLDATEAAQAVPDNYQRAWELWKKQATGAGHGSSP